MRHTVGPRMLAFLDTLREPLDLDDWDDDRTYYAATSYGGRVLIRCYQHGYVTREGSTLTLTPRGQMILSRYGR